MTRPAGVCFHGARACAFCGPADVAPWRRVVHRLLARPSCPSCGRRLRRRQPCRPCTTAGHHALTLFDEGAA